MRRGNQCERLPGAYSPDVTGHLFVVDGDITRLKCDAWLLPSDRAWHITPAFASALGMEGEGTYLRRPEAGWPVDGMFLHEAEDPNGPDVWLGDIGRHADEDPLHYASRAQTFARIAVERILDRRQEELSVQGRRPLIALNVLGTGRGGKRSRRGQLLQALLPALLDITTSEVDVVLVCYGPVMYSAVQSARRKILSSTNMASSWSEMGPQLLSKADEIADLARHRQLVLFLGAGISVDSGIPAWQHLLNTVAGEIGMSEQEIEQLSGFDPRDQGTILDKRLNGELGQRVQERMTVEKYGLVHALLASLPVIETVTTNFDQLFESACRASGSELAVLPGDQVLLGERWLLKLHGDVGGMIVFTRGDYLGAMATHSALRGIVQAMLMTRHMLFVGYSLRDDDFHQLVHEVRFARGESDTKFGTAMVLEKNELTSTLWPEIDFVSMEMERGSQNELLRAETYRAARQLWIFLDLVGMLSSSELAYLTDDSFGELQSNDETRLSQIVRDLEDFIRSTNGEWPEIREFLRRFGRHEG